METSTRVQNIVNDYFKELKDLLIGNNKAIKKLKQLKKFYLHKAKRPRYSYVNMAEIEGGNLNRTNLLILRKIVNPLYLVSIDTPCKLYPLNVETMYPNIILHKREYYKDTSKFIIPSILYNDLTAKHSYLRSLHNVGPVVMYTWLKKNNPIFKYDYNLLVDLCIEDNSRNFINGRYKMQ